MKTILILSALLSAVMASAQITQPQATVIVTKSKIKTSVFTTTQSVKVAQPASVQMQAMKSSAKMQSAVSATRGSEGVGGGDLCEDRIKIIRDDIHSWILKGGSNALALPAGVSSQQYSKAMLSAIADAKIRCVSQGDAGYPVQIDGVAKTCRFDVSTKDGEQITCDANKFQAIDESNQYVLIHHEYAGIAGLEKPNGADSKYDISNQLSGYLVDQVVKKLTVKSDKTEKYSDIYEYFKGNLGPSISGTGRVILDEKKMVWALKNVVHVDQCVNGDSNWIHVHDKKFTMGDGKTIGRVKTYYHRRSCEMESDFAEDSFMLLQPGQGKPWIVIPGVADYIDAIKAYGNNVGYASAGTNNIVIQAHTYISGGTEVPMIVKIHFSTEIAKPDEIRITDFDLY